MAENFNRAGVLLGTTQAVDVYSAPSTPTTARAIVLSCLVANINGELPSNITISIVNSSNVLQSRIASTITVPPDSSLEVIVNKLVLLSGEKLQATASDAGRLEITVSALEIS